MIPPPRPADLYCRQLKHDGILELLELDERTTIQDLQMILQRADSVSKRIAATHERSNKTERLHARPRAKRDSELGAARQR